MSCVVGPALVIAALTLFFWAVITMRKGGGSIPTHKPTDTIISAGPYKHSRNPIYLAMILLLIGIAVWTNSLWFILMAIIDAVLLLNYVILHEESYLERKFGESYTSYKSQVRRWL